MSTCAAEVFGKNSERLKSIQTYSANAQEYDQCFEGSFAPLFLAEFTSVEAALKVSFAENPFNVLEIGIGTGRFATHLKQHFPACQVFGLEPAAGMARICQKAFEKISDGVIVVEKKAEDLDAVLFGDTLMDCVLMVTTLGFLEDHALAVSKIEGVLAPEGCVCIAFINGETAWGAEYRIVTKDDKFYKYGTCILNATDVVSLFQGSGYQLWDTACFQTLVRQGSEPLDFQAVCDSCNPALAVLPGHGQGMWTVLTFRIA